MQLKTGSSDGGIWILQSFQQMVLFFLFKIQMQNYNKIEASSHYAWHASENRFHCLSMEMDNHVVCLFAFYATNADLNDLTIHTGRFNIEHIYMGV